MALKFDQVSDLGSDVEICMLTEKRQSGDTAAFNLNRFHFINLCHLSETDVPQHHLQRRIRQRSAIVLRYDDVLSLMTKLQQGFKHAVVLVIVSDKNVVDRF